MQISRSCLRPLQPEYQEVEPKNIHFHGLSNWFLDIWVDRRGPAGKEWAVLSCLLWFGDGNMKSCIQYSSGQHQMWSEGYFIPTLLLLLNYHSLSIQYLLCQALCQWWETKTWDRCGLCCWGAQCPAEHHVVVQAENHILCYLVL